MSQQEATPLICTMTGDMEVQWHTPGCLPHIKHMLAVAPQRPMPYLPVLPAEVNPKAEYDKNMKEAASTI